MEKNVTKIVVIQLIFSINLNVINKNKIEDRKNPVALISSPYVVIEIT